MPYALDIPRHLPGCLHWSDLPQTPAHSRAAMALNRVDCDVLLPVPLVQTHYEEDLKLFPIPDQLPDIFAGRWDSSIFVSERFKEIVSEMDPVRHLFQPVDLTMLNGTRYPYGYYALGIGDRVDAIDAVNSELAAKFHDGRTIRSLKTKGVKDVMAQGKSLGRFMHFTAARGEPLIHWREQQIAGRHLWMDKHYSSEAFLSDELAASFKKEGIKGLELRPSAITGATGRSSGHYFQRLSRRLQRARNRRYDALERLHEN